MNWWFKKHPQKLQDECNRLGGNSNYKEHNRERQNLLISQGEILVRLETTSRHPILIIYPESTPYSLPKIYPLSKLLGDDKFKQLAKLSSIEVSKKISDRVKFFNHWHQNSDGSLCFLEADNLESFGEYFSISDILNRARDWLVANIKGSEVPEGPEVQLFAHIRNVEFSIEILITEEIRDTTLKQGELYCTQISHVYPSESLLEKRIYLTTILEGETESGIRLEPIEFARGFDFMPNCIKSSGDIATKPEIIQREIEQKGLIKVFWWSVGEVDRPIQNINELAILIGEGDENSGFERIRKIIDPTTVASNDELVLAIRFVNRKNENQWQAFILKKKEAGSSQFPIIGSNQLSDYIVLFENYNLFGIRCSEFTDNRHHLRNEGVANRKILKSKSVSIIGCGALGSEVADTIAKAGIGHISLVDNEAMEMDNSIRHVIGIDKMGYAKVHALFKHIFYHNPFVSIEPLPFNLLNNNLEDYLKMGSIGLSTVADDNVEAYVNEQAVITNKTVFYARSLRGGKSARIFRVIPGLDACFNCLSLYKDESHADFTQISDDLTLPTLTNECNNPIRPSSASDLKLTSSLFTHIVIKHLLNGPEKSNHWIWSVESIDEVPENKMKPFTLVDSFLEPHPKCQFCDTSSKKFRVKIAAELMLKMVDETNINPEVETGGVLLGRMDNEKHLIEVTSISGPGPNSKKTKTSFLKDKKYCQEFIENEFVKSNQTKSYVGEWHYHPSVDNTASGTDLKSLSDIAEEHNYLTDTPVMIIFNNQGEASVTVHPNERSYYETSTIDDED